MSATGSAEVQVGGEDSRMNYEEAMHRQLELIEGQSTLGLGLA
jgi:hypothetical protein